jgi:hypothetical protein
MARSFLKVPCYDEYLRIKKKLKAKHTVYPFIAKDLVPITTGDFRVFDPEDKESPVSRICQDKANPLLGELCLCIWVWLLAVLQV